MVVELCCTVAEHGARLAGAGVAGILKKIGRGNVNDAAELPTLIYHSKDGSSVGAVLLATSHLIYREGEVYATIQIF